MNKPRTIEIENADKIQPRVRKLTKITGMKVKRINTLLIIHGIKAAEKDPTILTRINSELLTEA
jgi:hypothetical protein